MIYWTQPCRSSPWFCDVQAFVLYPWWRALCSGHRALTRVGIRSLECGVSQSAGHADHELDGGWPPGCRPTQFTAPSYGRRSVAIRRIRQATSRRPRRIHGAAAVVRRIFDLYARGYGLGGHVQLHRARRAESQRGARRLCVSWCHRFGSLRLGLHRVRLAALAGRGRPGPRSRFTPAGVGSGVARAPRGLLISARHLAAATSRAVRRPTSSASPRGATSAAILRATLAGPSSWATSWVPRRPPPGPTSGATSPRSLAWQSSCAISGHLASADLYGHLGPSQDLAQAALFCGRLSMPISPAAACMASQHGTFSWTGRQRGCDRPCRCRRDHCRRPESPSSSTSC